MNYLLSISFQNFSFRDKTIEYILNSFKIHSIEYSKDFVWFKAKRNDIKTIDFDEIKFNLSEKGILIIQNMNNSLPRIYGSEISINTVVFISEKMVELFSDLIVFGYIHPWLDSILQNTEEIKRWIWSNVTVPHYAQILPTPNYKEGAPGMDMISKEFISIESLPGHYHIMSYDEKLWFGSCWQMFFSPVYYKYIPQFLFDNFQDCFEHKIYENGLRKIILFENPEDFDLPKNRVKQWEFRRALGIDSIAHELTKANNRIEPKNLPVLITKKDCFKCNTRVDIYNQSKVQIKEFLDDGITLVFESPFDLPQSPRWFPRSRSALAE